MASQSYAHLNKKKLSYEEIEALSSQEKKAYYQEKKQRDKRRRAHLIDYTKRAGTIFIPGFVLELIATALELVAPLLIGKILNQEILEESFSPAAASNGTEYYFKMLGLYLLMVLFSLVFSFFGQYLFQKTANHIGRLIQVDVFKKLQSLPIAFFDQMAAGKIVSRVTNDANAIKMLYSQVIVRLITAFLYVAGIFTSLLLLDWRLFIMAVLPMPLLFFIFRDFQKKSSAFNRLSRQLYSELNAQLNENIQGMEVIQSLGREERIYNKFNDLNEELFENNFKFTKLYSYSSYNIVNLVDMLLMAIILAYFGYASYTGLYEVPVGNLYIFLEYMRRLFRQFRNVMDRIQTLERSTGAADHIFEILDLDSLSYVEGSLGKLQGEIEFSKVSFSYVEGEPVLKNISFQVPAGSSAAFVGATGSGKSTIMNLLAGFYPLDTGEIYIDGKNFNDISLPDYRRQMVLVLQDPYLFTGTLHSNIALDNEQITPELAEEALREVGGSKLLDNLDKGILSEVKNQGKSFSTGERQLISFARALAQNPKILILDEATANIDTETEGIIQEGINKLKESRSMLMIAHRLSTIKDVDKIYVLDKGEIKESGSHEELMALNGIYAKMYLEQSKSISQEIA